MSTTNIITKNKDIARVLVVTATILSLPLIAMQFTNEVNWGPEDFAAAGVILSVFGLLIVLASRMLKSTKQKVIAILVLIGLLLVTWAHLAVGIVDTWPFAGS